MCRVSSALMTISACQGRYCEVLLDVSLLFISNVQIMEQAAVTRSPTFFPGDIRLLQAVHHPALFELLKDTSGGVIVFSTHGRQTPVAYMSGGDFDGDKYYAIFNSEVVGWIKEVDPFVDNEISDLEKVTSTSDSELSCTDLRWKILSGKWRTNETNAATFVIFENVSFIFWHCYQDSHMMHHNLLLGGMAMLSRYFYLNLHPIIPGHSSLLCVASGMAGPECTGRRPQ